MRLLASVVEIVFALNGNKLVKLHEDDCISAHSLQSTKPAECTLWLPQGVDEITLRVGTDVPTRISAVFDEAAAAATQPPPEPGRYVLDGARGDDDEGYSSRSVEVWLGLRTSASAVAPRKLWWCEPAGTAHTAAELAADAHCKVHYVLNVGQKAIWLEDLAGELTWEPGKALAMATGDEIAGDQVMIEEIAEESNTATDFEQKLGKGSLIVSGLDLDLNSCNHSASLPPSEHTQQAPSMFSRWVSKTLVEAAVDRVVSRRLKHDDIDAADRAAHLKSQPAGATQQRLKTDEVVLAEMDAMRSRITALEVLTKQLMDRLDPEKENRTAKGKTNHRGRQLQRTGPDATNGQRAVRIFTRTM